MNKYKVIQLYAPISKGAHVHEELDNKIIHGVIEAKDAETAIRIVSYQTDVPIACLTAQGVE